MLCNMGRRRGTSQGGFVYCVCMYYCGLRCSYMPMLSYCTIVLSCSVHSMYTAQYTPYNSKKHTVDIVLVIRTWASVSRGSAEQPSEHVGTRPLACESADRNLQTLFLSLSSMCRLRNGNHILRTAPCIVLCTQCGVRTVYTRCACPCVAHPIGTCWTLSYYTVLYGTSTYLVSTQYIL